jgi:hypothetical protein
MLAGCVQNLHMVVMRAGGNANSVLLAKGTLLGLLFTAMRAVGEGGVFVFLGISVAVIDRLLSVFHAVLLLSWQSCTPKIVRAKLLGCNCRTTVVHVCVCAWHLHLGVDRALFVHWLLLPWNLLLYLVSPMGRRKPWRGERLKWKQQRFAALQVVWFHTQPSAYTITCECVCVCAHLVIQFVCAAC